ncbi:MAG TPA: DUF4405 domain-containing protein [Candidatus Gallacutalibacter stercoravium]|nr:DUF4405 domain-containing protein [Candidatus Gallacutalibacter stercoravium]
MRKKAAVQMAVDAAMTVLLMLLMAFELIGRTAHEWLGAGMFVLFIIHHILNRKWSKNLLRGKYTPFRVLQTALVLLVLLAMLGSAAGAVLISRRVFAFLPVSGGRGLGRTLHMLSSYWGFVLLALHLGVHWNSMLARAGRLCRGGSRLRGILLRVAGVCVAVYGAYAFVGRGLPSYLFLQTQFVFFNFDEPLALFFVDYLAIMGLFVWIGHYLAKAARRLEKPAGR